MIILARKTVAPFTDGQIELDDQFHETGYEQPLISQITGQTI